MLVHPSVSCDPVLCSVHSPSEQGFDWSGLSVTIYVRMISVPIFISVVNCMGFDLTQVLLCIQLWNRPW